MPLFGGISPGRVNTLIFITEVDCLFLRYDFKAVDLPFQTQGGAFDTVCVQNTPRTLKKRNNAKG